jgi:hypothetical protein
MRYVAIQKKLRSGVRCKGGCIRCVYLQQPQVWLRKPCAQAMLKIKIMRRLGRAKMSWQHVRLIIDNRDLYIMPNPDRNQESSWFLRVYFCDFDYSNVFNKRYTCVILKKKTSWITCFLGDCLRFQKHEDRFGRLKGFILTSHLKEVLSDMVTTHSHP